MRVEDRKLEQQKLEIQMKKIEMGNFTDTDEMGANTGYGKDSFKFAGAMKFVPKFESSDVEHYLVAFEKAMALHKIPNDKWTALLHPQLTGKAQKVFSELSIEECSDYEIVKKALLIAYERVPEFYRKRFRNMGKEKLETYSNYAFRMQLPFQRWLEGEGAVEDEKRMAEVFKLEQFVKCLPPELHRWLVDKKPLTLSAAAKLADEYAVLYKQVPMEATGGPKQDSFSWRRNSPQRGNSGFQRFAHTREGHDVQPFGEQVVCNYCKSVGHLLSQCDKLKQRRERSGNENWRSGPKHVGLVNEISAPVNVHGLVLK